MVGICNMILITLLVMGSFGAFSLSIAQASFEATDARVPLATVLRTNVPVWAGIKNSVTIDNTVVTAKTLIDELSDPSQCPDSAAAAALAALITHIIWEPGNNGTISINNSISIPPSASITTAYWDNLAKEINVHQAKYGEVGAYEKFHETLTAVKKSNYALYTSQQPKFKRLKQNKIGDCYFISALGWLAFHQPSDIEKMISTSEINTSASATAIPVTYMVNFLGDSEPISVKLTEAELVFFSSPSTLSDGIWEAVLQKAIGIYFTQHPELAPNDPSDIVEPILNVNWGHRAAIIQQLFSATNSKVAYFSNASTVLTADSLNAYLRAALPKSGEKYMVQFLSGKNASASIPGDHWYAVLSYEPWTNGGKTRINYEKSMVTLWNPWGDDWGNSQTFVVPNYPRRDGIFTISISDIIKIQMFSCMVIEGAAPSPNLSAHEIHKNVAIHR